LIDIDQKSIDIDQDLIDIDQKSIDIDHDLIDINQKAIDINHDLIDGDQKLIHFDQESIDVDQESIGIDHESINVDQKCIEIRTLGRLQPRQLLLRIVSWVHLRMGLGDAAFLVDEVGDPFRVFVFRRVGGAVGDTDLAVGVTQQGEGEFVFLSEAGVGVDVVETGAEDGGVLRFVLVDEVPEPGTLGRSARCVGLRIEPQHDLASAQIVQRNLAAVMIQHFEIRGFVSNLEHASSSRLIQADSMAGNGR